MHKVEIEPQVAVEYVHVYLRFYFISQEIIRKIFSG